MFDWRSVVLTLGSTSIVTAGIIWLLKTLADQYFKKSLQTHQADLEQNASLQLAAFESTLKERTDERLALIEHGSRHQLQQQQHELSLAEREEQDRSQARAQQVERARQEIERWANPILGAVRELSRRLANILDDEGYLALSPVTAGNLPRDWSIDFDYFMSSTVFLFCQYFCWERLLQERLTFDLFGEGIRKDQFLAKLANVRKPLGSWPLEKITTSPSGDVQLFSLQQRALGESLIEGMGTDSRCMRASNFFDQWGRPAFRAKFAPLVRLLEGVTPDSVRGERLRRAYDALVAVEKECEKVLSPRSS